MIKPQRKHIRLRDFDYSSENAYFITICTKDRKSFLGKIENDEMFLSSIGEIAKQYWDSIPQHYPHLTLDEFVVMPNHIHGILILDYGSSTRNSVQEVNQFSKPVSGSVSIIIGQYKSAIKKWCNENEFQDFQWQSRFHDHVIRNGEDYENIKNYIVNNIINWKDDKFFT